MLLQSLYNALSNLLPQRNASTAAKTQRVAPRLETLEAREVLSASVGFQQGILQIHLANNGRSGESVVVKNNGGYVYVGNGAGSQAFNPHLHVAANQVREIRVYGSDRGDTINLSEVQRKHFSNIQSTWVEGRGGNDRILGSQVADILFGQGGHDWIDGQDGQDKIYGGTGNDTLAGGRHSDRIYGEQGNDTLFGRSSSHMDSARDYLFGGSGYDVAALVGAKDILRGIERRR